MGVLVFLKGQFMPEAQALIPVNDRGFLLGDGLFETMLVVGGKPFLFGRHVERMTRGADFFKIKMPFSPEELQNFAAQLIERNQMPEAVLRLTLTRGPGRRGYAPDTSCEPTLVMTLHPAPPETRIQWKLVTSSFCIPAGNPLSAYKTTSKILHVMAQAEAVAKGADDALLLNTNGDVAETASGNLFWAHENMLCTAPTTCGVLPGITRAIVLEICGKLGIKLKVRAIGPEALRNSEGLFVTQSVLGIVPVAMFDGKPLKSSPLVYKIADNYHETLTA
jgi:branched-chain amino acid aminotransferase